MLLNGSFEPVLQLEPLTASERQELQKIWHDYNNYLKRGIVLEKLVKPLTIFPLLRLAGFYERPLQLSIEEGIDRIDIEDEDTCITGRFDILAINPTITSGGKPFWILVIESKNSNVDFSAGLPQLLTYAYPSLTYQDSVWGMVTNGLTYQFVLLKQGTPALYEMMPTLHLYQTIDAFQLLQVLKAICHLQHE